MIKNVNNKCNAVIGDVYGNTEVFNSISGSLTKAKEATPEQFKEILLLQCNLIQEELDETIKAIEDNDLIEQVDGAADVLVTASGLVQLLQTKVKAEEAALEVSQNNLTKFLPIRNPDVQSIALQTRDKYSSQNIEIVMEQNQEYAAVVFKNKATGKVLKPSSYKPVDLSGFV